MCFCWPRSYVRDVATGRVDASSDVTYLARVVGFAQSIDVYGVLVVYNLRHASRHLRILWLLTGAQKRVLHDNGTNLVYGELHFCVDGNVIGSSLSVEPR